MTHRSTPVPDPLVSAPRGRVIIFNKPFGVLCQFTGEAGQRTLAEFIKVPGVYAAGRLDADSEGLLVLTADGRLQSRIAEPRHRKAKVYLAQVEGDVGDEALKQLARGVDLGDFVTAPASVRRVEEPAWLWPRNPPIRTRKNIPVCWLELTLQEGKNRQVRRMTARVGHPTLRLVRVAVGPWQLDGLQPGEMREDVAPRNW